MIRINGNGWTATFDLLGFVFDRKVDQIYVVDGDLPTGKSLSDLRGFCAKHLNANVAEMTLLLNDWFEVA